MEAFAIFIIAGQGKIFSSGREERIEESFHGDCYSRFTVTSFHILGIVGSLYSQLNGQRHATRIVGRKRSDDPVTLFATQMCFNLRNQMSIFILPRDVIYNQAIAIPTQVGAI
jgi:hypothetical protein